MDVHSKIKKLQEILDELKKEVGYSDDGSQESKEFSEEDDLGEEMNLSDSPEEDEQSHFETHRL